MSGTNGNLPSSFKFRPHQFLSNPITIDSLQIVAFKGDFVSKKVVKKKPMEEFDSRGSFHQLTHQQVDHFFFNTFQVFAAKRWKQKSFICSSKKCPSINVQPFLFFQVKLMSINGQWGIRKLGFQTSSPLLLRQKFPKESLNADEQRNSGSFETKV